MYINQDHIEKLYEVISFVLMFEKKNYFLFNYIIGDVCEVKSINNDKNSSTKMYYTYVKYPVIYTGSKEHELHIFTLKIIHTTIF